MFINYLRPQTRNKIKGINVPVKCIVLIAGILVLSNVLAHSIFPADAPECSQLISNPENSLDMQLTKAFVEKRLPQLAKLDNYQKSAMLRNFVYTTIGANGSASFDVPMTYEKFLQFMAGNMKISCGMLSMEYLALLKLYGIPAHLVDLSTDKTYSAMATEAQAAHDTHVAVEVFVDNRWILQDPTFNIHWVLKHEPLNAISLSNAFSQRLNPTADSDGYSFLPGRSIDEYYIPYRKLLEHVQISHYAVWGSEPCSGRQAMEMSYPKVAEVVKAPDRAEGTPIQDYDFRQTIPADWVVSSPSTTRILEEMDSLIYPGLSHQSSVFLTQLFPPYFTAVNVTIFCKPFGYVMQTATPIVLKPGSYQMIVDAEISNGGIDVGVLDGETQQWINQKTYHYDAIYFDKPLVTPFVIPKAGKYNLVLANYAKIYGEISQWRLKHITITSNNAVKPQTCLPTYYEKKLLLFTGNCYFQTVVPGFQHDIFKATPYLSALFSPSATAQFLSCEDGADLNYAQARNKLQD